VNDATWLAKYHALLEMFAAAHPKEPGIAAFHAAARGTIARAA